MRAHQESAPSCQRGCWCRLRSGGGDAPVTSATRSCSIMKFAAWRYAFHRPSPRGARTGSGALALLCALAPVCALRAADHGSISPADNAGTAMLAPAPLLALGLGDAASMQVYGRPALTTTTYIADDGTIPVPLAGRVPVAGLSPADAAERVAAAFRDGKFLVDPQVTLFLVQMRSQQVSVLGAVRTPGRYPVESTATVM